MNAERRTRQAAVVWCSMLVAAAGACGGERDDAGGTDADETKLGSLYYKASGIWATKLLNVCWEADTAPYPTEKAWVQQILKGQRSWEWAGNIVLKGFAACTGSSQPGIHLEEAGFGTDFLGNPGSGINRIGLDFRALVHTLYPRCLDNSLSRQDCIITGTLHEFGHALAIAHEHARPDPPGPINCGDPGSTGDTTYGTWDEQSIMNYCNSPIHLSGIDRKGFQLMYGQPDANSYRLRDFNNDNRADLLCFDTTNGSKWVDYANGLGRYEGTDWSSGPVGMSCASPTNRLYTGHFAAQATSTTDLLCHDFVNGPEQIDFGPNGYNGWEKAVSPPGWCTHPTGRLFVGDFDGSGLDDLLCHDVSNGYMWIDYNDGTGGFAGTDWERAANWCWGKNGSLHIGKFNADWRSDLLCHDRNSGFIWVDYADSNGRFMGTDWVSSQGKCYAPSQEVRIGDFNGDLKDDFMCHDLLSGLIWLDYADANGQLSPFGWDWVQGNFCAHSSGRLYVGKMNADQRDDLLCHDVATGTKWIDFADSNGRFNGFDWWLASGWCGHYSGQIF